MLLCLFTDLGNIELVGLGVAAVLIWQTAVWVKEKAVEDKAGEEKEGNEHVS